MNSRSSVSETNFVNLSANLSTLDPLDTKDPLSLGFPFDHIYACHSEGSDHRQTLSLDKDVEISTHCVDVTDQKDLVVSTSSEINRLSQRLTAAENQNKKLKDLLVYHLDLIQQQNDVITKREKLYQALKQENDTLKTKVTRMDKKGPGSQKQTVTFPAPIVHVPPSIVAPPVVKTEPGTPSSQVMYNSYPELLLPDRTNPYLFNDITKPNPYPPSDPFNLGRASETEPSYLGDLSVPPILEENVPSDNSTMIENKRSSFLKKETKPEPRPEPLYTITSNSGNPVIQKIHRNRRRTSSSFGSLSRMPKTPAKKVETPETGLKVMFGEDKSFERSYSVNKKSKMINTYGKSKTTTLPKRMTLFTGSLSDRLQLIDTTPTGEDPYQLGEADMREQSPIPKLMLQKTNHGRMKICSDIAGNSTTSSRRIYDAPATETSTRASNKIKLENRYNLPSTIYDTPATETTTKSSNKIKLESRYHLPSTIYDAPTTETSTKSSNKIKLESRYHLPSTIYDAPATEISTKSSNKIKLESRYNVTSTITRPDIKQEIDPEPQIKTPIVHEPDLDLVKTEPEIEWRINPAFDYGYGNPMDTMEPSPQLNIDDYQTLPTTDSTDLQKNLSSTLSGGDFRTVEFRQQVPQKAENEKTLDPEVRPASLVAPNQAPEPVEKRGTVSKRGRKRALSTTGLLKAAKQGLPKPPAAPKAKQTRGRAACRGKKSPVPGMVSTSPYHTLMGDPDLSWYLGVDPALRVEDFDLLGDNSVSTVEVPRWREKPYTSLYTLEGTENLDDKVFEKRHQKLEAEERRQLRWHMRRIREQRHVERLRQRHRESWCSGLTSPAYQQPSMYTIWPQPQRDVRVIEITDTLPVMAFGEDLPELPPADFMLPWVRTSKALKRSKRSKTHI